MFFVFAEIKITGLGIILGFGLEGHKLGVCIRVCVSAILLEQNIRKGQILILFKSIDFFNKSIKRVLSS